MQEPEVLAPLAVLPEECSAVNPANSSDGASGERGLQAYVDIAEVVAQPVLPPIVAEGKTKPLQRLTIRHRRMIALFLQGYDYREIGEALGCHPGTVGAVITNPTGQLLINKALRESDASLRALAPLAVRAIRTGLLSKDNRTQLQAVDRLHRSIGKYGDTDPDAVSAEDVIQRLIKIRHTDGTEVTIADQRIKR